MEERGKLGLVLKSRVMFSKYLILFSLDGTGCVPPLLFGLRPNYGSGNEDNGDLLQKNFPRTIVFSASDPAAGHC